VEIKAETKTELKKINKEVIRETQSLCPVCLKRISARHVREYDNVYLEKTCEEHGSFRAVIWRGEKRFPMERWRGPFPVIPEGAELPCVSGCGLCQEHTQETCCILVEVTNRCNLNCGYCFAGDSIEDEPPIETVKKWLSDLADTGRTFVQFSGGEPTLRDDLPEIVAHAKQRGFRYLQLNTNGLRLAEDIEYVKKLADAGLSFVFLQFDGKNNKIYRALRGFSLFDIKRNAIESCAKHNLGVSLVCTVVPGVNDESIGELVKFGVSLSPAVRGVHFQPVSYFGRHPALPGDEMRITLPELILKIQRQTQGEISADCFSPSNCDHPMCGFHGDFVVMPDGLRPLSKWEGHEEKSCCCPSPPTVHSAAERSRRFVGRRWERPQKPCCDGPHDIETFDGFLERVGSHGFTITAMAFQDCGNIDLERLRRCSVHVYSDGKVIPLCARYLTSLKDQRDWAL
jgi:uncharacterized radical SAM superfamily Fe-S cluster-containing enzyme